MKKLIAFILSTVIFTSLAIAQDEQMKIDALKKTVSQKNLSYSDRVAAYISLIDCKSAGYKAICELLANGDISFENWINFGYDHSTRFEDGTEKENSFDEYLLDKLEEDKGFTSAFINSLFAGSEAKGSGIGLIAFLKDSKAGVRHLGYLILQKKYKNLPAFEYLADEQIRAKQIAAIESFLKKQ